MAQQTAVEWLQIKMATSSTQEMIENINVWFKEAKQMEKEQIKVSYGVGRNDGCAYMTDNKPEFEDQEQYYNETFTK